MTEDYDVGWGKPPQHSRFKKGRSGSPNGRPPKARNLKTELGAELGARIRVREGDREVSISKQEAFIKTLVARALKGDARASSLLVGLMAKLLDVEVDLAERGVEWRCHAASGLRSRWRFCSQGDEENQLSRLPLSARDHPPGDLALSRFTLSLIPDW